jgi:hypothetical protein
MTDAAAEAGNIVPEMTRGIVEVEIAEVEIAHATDVVETHQETDIQNQTRGLLLLTAIALTHRNRAKR